MNIVTQWMLERLLKKPCPVEIPRTGESGKQVDCYYISLYEGDSPVLLVNSIGNNGVGGKLFQSAGFRAEASIPFSLYSGLRIRVDHYHGLVTHTYRGMYDYILHEWTLFYKLQSIYVLAKHSVPQFFFNNKKLQLPQRMKILESIIAMQSEEPDRAFSSLDLMSYMYSIRWYLHPNKTATRKKLDLYLSSFVASGELKNANNRSIDFEITGKAIATLEEYQIETARAKSAKSANSWMLRLTAILAFFAAFQSELIKSPTWIDLGKIWEWLSLQM